MQFPMSQIDYVVIPGWTFELEIAQWAEVDLRVVPRLVDDASWAENIAADEFMLQPGGIGAITEFWNWLNDGLGSGGELPGTEPPEEWKRYFDWQRQFRTDDAS